jgi:hypothetical protein
MAFDYPYVAIVVYVGLCTWLDYPCVAIVVYVQCRSSFMTFDYPYVAIVVYVGLRSWLLITHMVSSNVS